MINIIMTYECPSSSGGKEVFATITLKGAIHCDTNRCERESKSGLIRASILNIYFSY